MRKYHHIGLPTSERRDGETYLADYKAYCSGLDSSDFGIQWIRFDPESPLPEMLKKVAHVAFEVDDMALEIEGRKILVPPGSPTPDFVIAFIEDNGAPVELMQKVKTEGATYD